jgi:hypothetical protein
MDSLTIRYWSPHGRQDETKFRADERKIDLVMRAAFGVDLSGLESCSQLESLDLSHNMLEFIDLEPLARCSSLQQIILEDNRLSEVNLWPLDKSEHLTHVELAANRINTLDATPVLLRVRMTMDASVVVSADSILRWVLTQKEKEHSIRLVRSDRVSWSGYPVVLWTGYDSFSNAEWSVASSRIRSVLNQISPSRWFGAQRGLLFGLGLHEIAGYDGDPRHLLDTACDSMRYAEAVEAIHEHALDLLQEQVSRCGPTLFLDAELMRRTGASRIIPALVERRRQEIDELLIPRRGSRVYLRGLWTTYYGFQILSALGLGLRTDMQGLKRVEACFSDLGFELQVVDSPTSRVDYSVSASDSLKKHVRDLVLGHYDPRPLY